MSGEEIQSGGKLLPFRVANQAETAKGAWERALQ